MVQHGHALSWIQYHQAFTIQRYDSSNWIWRIPSYIKPNALDHDGHDNIPRSSHILTNHPGVNSWWISCPNLYGLKSQMAEQLACIGHLSIWINPWRPLSKTWGVKISGGLPFHRRDRHNLWQFRSSKRWAASENIPTSLREGPRRALSYQSHMPFS